jgi:hypothetical protein
MKTRTDLSHFTDLTVVGTGEDIAALTRIAQRGNALVYRSAPERAGPGDPRVRFRLRLRRP